MKIQALYIYGLRNVSLVQKSILVLIWQTSNRKPSRLKVSTLTRLCSTSERSVQRALAGLRKSRLISNHAIPGHANSYRLGPTLRPKLEKDNELGRT